MRSRALFGIWDSCCSTSGGGGGGALALNDLTDVDVSAAVPGEFLTLNGSGTWVGGVPAGGGDVVGPAGATDDAVVRFDGVTGKLIQESPWIADDFGNMSMVLDADILPAGDALGRVGAPGTRFRRGYFQQVVTGDLELNDESRGVRLVLMEHDDHFEIINSNEKRQFVVPFVEVPYGASPAEKRELLSHYSDALRTALSQSPEP